MRNENMVEITISIHMRRTNWVNGTDKIKILTPYSEFGLIILIKCFLDQHLYATFKQIELDYGALSTLPECCKYPKRRFQKGLAYTAYRDCRPPLQVVERGRAHNHWGMGSVSANHLQGYSGTTHLAVARLEEIKLAKLEILHLIKPIQINFPQLATFIGYNSLSIKHGYHRHSSNIIS